MRMWEENQQYQDASFKTVMQLVGAGTLTLGILCFLGDQEEILRNWISGVFLFIGAWLVIVGIIYLVVHLFRSKSPRLGSPKASDK